MEMSYYEIAGLMVMGIKIGSEYEYYVRDMSESDDVFKFAFAVMDEFSEEDLLNMSAELWEYQDNY